MTKEQQVYSEIERYNTCGMLKGGENVSELMDMFFTPQGLETCTTYKVPSLATCRMFDRSIAERGGFYIDKNTRMKNVERVALIGETNAELEFTETKRFIVVLMHGARAKIIASGHSVVFVTNAGGEVEVVKKDSAKVFL